MGILSRIRCVLAARWLLIALFVLNLYRAATLSISTDEAFTYNRGVVTPIPRLWDSYDANDHILHTLLCKATVRMFGLAEFTLRMPSLLGGALYFWVILRLSQLLFGNGMRMLVAVALLSLNPFLLDYCSIARGYGMANALLLLAFYQLVRYWEAPHMIWRLYAAGIALALGVAANLTVLVPGVCLVFGFAALFLGEAVRQRNWERLRVRLDNLSDHMVVPGLAVAALLLIVPLMGATRKDFYYGATNLWSAAQSIVVASLLRQENWLGWRAWDQVMRTVCQGIAWVGLPVLVGAAMVTAIRRWPRSAPQRFLALAAVVLGGALVLWVTTNRLLGVPYPLRRTGLWLVPILTLLAVMLWERLPRWAGAGAAGFVLLQFALNLNLPYYDEWLFDAGTKAAMRMLRDQRPEPGKRVRLASSPFIDQDAYFYRRLYRMDWLELNPIGAGADKEADWYLLTGKDVEIARRPNMEVPLWHRKSGVVLARPNRSQ